MDKDRIINGCLWPAGCEYNPLKEIHKVGAKFTYRVELMDDVLLTVMEIRKGDFPSVYMEGSDGGSYHAFLSDLLPDQIKLED